jgi:hypothetical protein
LLEIEKLHATVAGKPILKGLGVTANALEAPARAGTRIDGSIR